MNARAYPPPRIDARITTRVVLGDETWAALAPLIPPLPPRRRDHGGRRPLDDRAVLVGILTILANGIGFETLPAEFGYGSGMTCWRRLRHWHQAGAWPGIAQKLREVLPPGSGVDLARVDRLFHLAARPCGRGRGSAAGSAA